MRILEKDLCMGWGQGEVMRRKSSEIPRVVLAKSVTERPLPPGREISKQHALADCFSWHPFPQVLL